MFFENLKLALHSMMNSKMRTFLSLLGIIIGVGSVVAILNLGQSANESITESMQVGGIDMINVMPVGWSRGNSSLNEEFASNFSKNVDGIENVVVTVSSSANLRNGKEIAPGVSLQGVTSEYFDVNSLEMLEGRFFDASDNINRRQVIVLGHDLAEDLFPAGGAVGNYVSIFRNQSKRYQVIGVLEEKDQTIGSSYNSVAFIPFNTFDQRFRRVDQVSSYVMKIADGFDPLEVSKSVEQYLNSIVDSNDYLLYTPASMVEMADQITKTFASFLAAIAAISLLVGGIGIMNIMLVSVVERTREIGIRKALGATPKTIQGQFLVESIVLTVCGGILGILFGIFVSFFVVRYVGWTLHLSYFAIILALIFSMFVGVFFGWYPAKKASKLDPIQALSYE